jgi:hypothetical protein
MYLISIHMYVYIHDTSMCKYYARSLNTTHFKDTHAEGQIFPTLNIDPALVRLCT